MEYEIIFKICTQTRNSILAVKDKTSIFKDFPFGCCRDSSLLIGKILTEKGFKNLNYCRSTFDNDTKSHAWLEYKNYIIDITASQFGNSYENVIVKSNKKRDKIHTKSNSEPYKLEIAGIDTIRIIEDYNIIKIIYNSY